MKPNIKSRAFKSLLPTIMELYNRGYSYKQITTILRENHDLDLSEKLFSVYFIRYGKNKSSNLGNVNSSSISSNVNGESKIQNEISTNEAFSGREYQFGTPEHRGRVQAETEASFKSNQKIGLRNR